MNVSLFDLQRVLSEHNDELTSAFKECLSRGHFILGPDVALFESAFSSKIGTKYCVGVSSGTDALLAIFTALNLKPGSEIIVPSFTFVASASSILRAGLTPVFADLEEGSFSLSLNKIKDVWTKKTKGVLFVHLFGGYTDLSEINQFCVENGAALIEDCAQSYGSAGGTQGLAGAFSFFPAKNLGCLGDGGAVVTNDENLHERIKKIRTHGSEKRYFYDHIGGNFRLDTIQAAFLNKLMPHSNRWIRKRRENAAFYNNSLSDLASLTLPTYNEDHAWNQYTLRTERRDDLKKYLDSKKIGNAIYYPYPLHKSAIFDSGRTLIETERRCKEVISIPIYPGLSERERECVAITIKEFFK
jgi:dTDP-4-amino-4,6-dideoxygalactose transaminase